MNLKLSLLLILSILVINIVHAQYNLTLEAQLYNPITGDLLTGTYNINVTITNSTNNIVHMGQFNSTTLDSRGRFFKYLNISYDFHDDAYIQFSIEGFTSPPKSYIGYVAYSINSQLLQGKNASYFATQTNLSVLQANLSSLGNWSANQSSYPTNININENMTQIASNITLANASIKSYVDSSLDNNTVARTNKNNDFGIFNLFGNALGSVSNWWNNLWVHNATIGNATIKGNIYDIAGNAYNLSQLNSTPDLSSYAKYQFGNNSFNGSGNFTIMGALNLKGAGAYVGNDLTAYIHPTLGTPYIQSTSGLAITANSKATDFIYFGSGSDIYFDLGDSSGDKKVLIRDGGTNVVASIDSDGKINGTSISSNLYKSGSGNNMFIWDLGGFISIWKNLNLLNFNISAVNWIKANIADIEEKIYVGEQTQIYEQVGYGIRTIINSGYGLKVNNSYDDTSVYLADGLLEYGIYVNGTYDDVYIEGSIDADDYFTHTPLFPYYDGNLISILPDDKIQADKKVNVFADERVNITKTDYSNPMLINSTKKVEFRKGKINQSNREDLVFLYEKEKNITVKKNVTDAKTNETAVVFINKTVVFEVFNQTYEKVVGYNNMSLSERTDLTRVILQNRLMLMEYADAGVPLRIDNNKTAYKADIAIIDELYMGSKDYEQLGKDKNLSQIYLELKEIEKAYNGTTFNHSFYGDLKITEKIKNVTLNKDGTVNIVWEDEDFVDLINYIGKVRRFSVMIADEMCQKQPNQWSWCIKK